MVNMSFVSLSYDRTKLRGGSKKEVNMSEKEFAYFGDVSCLVTDTFGKFESSTPVGSV